MEELQSRFERIRYSISAELSDVETVSFSPALKDETLGRNINYYRRLLYSEIELFKMELEECISVDDCINSGEKDDNSNAKGAIDRMSGKSHNSNSSSNNSPPRNVSNITSPLMNRLDVLSSNTSYVDGNRSGIKSKTTYNDIDSHGNTDRERLLNDQSSSSSSSNHSGKHSIHVDDNNIIESKSSEKSCYRSPLKEDYKKNDLILTSIPKESSSMKIIDVRENVHYDILKIKQMIEECSSISGRFGLKFAHRNPHWCAINFFYQLEKFSSHDVM